MKCPHCGHVQTSAADLALRRGEKPRHFICEVCSLVSPIENNPPPSQIAPPVATLHSAP